MKKKLEVIFKTKNLLIFSSGICVLLIVISFFFGGFLAPVKNAVTSFILPMQKGINYIGLWASESIQEDKDIEKLKEEKASLEKIIEELKAENNNLKQQTYEIDRYKELFDMAQELNYEVTGANVIGRSAGNWFSTFTIDKGSKDGIQVDMNVVAQGGLVGIVTEVGEHTSVVTSIICDNSNVSGMLMGSGDICTVGGSLKLIEKDVLSLFYLDKEAVVRNGDKIVTSHISSKYLEGILIGYAKDVKMDANSLTQSGYVVPAVDFKHLQEVLIILEKKQQ